MSSHLPDHRSPGAIARMRERVLAAEAAGGAALRVGTGAPVLPATRGDATAARAA